MTGINEQFRAACAANDWVTQFGDPNDTALMERLWADPPADWLSPTVDRNRLLTVLAFIEAHPEQWSQECFESATRQVGCFGGIAVALELEVSCAMLRRTLRMRNIAIDVGLYVPYRAMELLGLTVPQAMCIIGYVSADIPPGQEVKARFQVAGRHITFAELVDRVRLVTGVDYFARPPLGPDQAAVPSIGPVAVQEPELVGAAA